MGASGSEVCFFKKIRVYAGQEICEMCQQIRIDLEISILWDPMSSEAILIAGQGSVEDQPMGILTLDVASMLPSWPGRMAKAMSRGQAPGLVQNLTLW